MDFPIEKSGVIMTAIFQALLTGYQGFRKKYATGDNTVMQSLAHAQKPSAMIAGCCDSRVDPSLLLQCHPGDLFVVRNVANIVPPYECDEKHHGTSAALEFGVCQLNIKHLIILGHSQCGGIHALLNGVSTRNDFIANWVSQIHITSSDEDLDTVAKNALTQSYQHCLSFPWIKSRLDNNTLIIHRWFFDIKTGEISAYDMKKNLFLPLQS